VISRHRGEHHARGLWHPRRGADTAPVPTTSPSEPTQPPEPSPAELTELARQAAADAVAELATAAATDLAGARTVRRRRSRARSTLLMLAVAIGLFAAAAGQGGSAPAASDESALPASPRQWVDAYMAAAVDDPHRVCSQLLAPPLAAQFAAAAHASSCTGYFAHVRSTSLQVRRVLHDGGTAVVELHQTVEKTDWNVVLDHHGDGWRAIDLVPGRPLR